MEWKACRRWHTEYPKCQVFHDFPQITVIKRTKLNEKSAILANITSHQQLKQGFSFIWKWEKQLVSFKGPQSWSHGNNLRVRSIVWFFLFINRFTFRDLDYSSFSYSLTCSLKIISNTFYKAEVQRQNVSTNVLTHFCFGGPNHGKEKS